jgi:integrase
MSAGPDKLDPLVAQYLLASRADNTRRAYESDLKRFVAWGGNIPSTSDEIMRYLAQNGSALRPSTLRRHLAAIASAHRDLGVTDVTKAPIVGRVLQGIRRSHGNKPNQVAPLLIEDLARIVSSLGTSRRDRRDRAILLIGFFGALRRSELVELDLCDVEFGKKSIVLTIRRSKTDQSSLGRMVHLIARADELCPLRALNEYLGKIPEGERALFAGSKGQGNPPSARLSTRTVARVVKSAAARIGLDPTLFGGHSLRAGFVTTAAMAGFDAPLIAKQTGHRAVQTVSAYVRSVAFPELKRAVR